MLIEDLLARAQALDKPNGCPRPSRRGPHTSIVIGFTKAIAREGARYGVRCNAVAPGPTDTPLLSGLADDPLGAGLRQGMIDATLLRRCGQPDEVAAAIAYLASDDASFLTGQTLAVSGGLSMS
jgi:2-hydroxycyclohexanecarboxyl-CoA dehydrogenase